MRNSSSTSRSHNNRERGWFGDSEGHSEAAQQGWDHREGNSSSRRNNYYSDGRRNRREDDDSERGGNRYNSSRYRENYNDYNEGREGEGRGHGGWFGDSEGHSEASFERGRQNRGRGRY